VSTRIRGHQLNVGDEVTVLSFGKNRPGIFKGMNGQLLDVEIHQHGRPHRICVAEQNVRLSDDYDEVLLTSLERIADRYFD
jgi:hypothetical protein